MHSDTHTHSFTQTLITHGHTHIEAHIQTSYTDTHTHTPQNTISIGKLPRQTVVNLWSSTLHSALLNPWV